MLRTVLAVATGLVICASTVPAQHPPGRLIVGFVTDSASGRGLEDVQVVVRGARLGSMTKANGQYRVHGVPAGDSVTLEAKVDGYVARSIRVPPGPDTVIVSFRLPRSKEPSRKFFPIPVDTTRPSLPIPRRAR
jgi:hypothetical protein